MPSIYRNEWVDLADEIYLITSSYKTKECVNSNTMMKFFSKLHLDFFPWILPILQGLYKSEIVRATTYILPAKRITWIHLSIFFSSYCYMMEEWSHDRKKNNHCTQAHHEWGGQPYKLEGCQEGFQVHPCSTRIIFSKLRWWGGLPKMQDGEWGKNHVLPK